MGLLYITVALEGQGHIPAAKQCPRMPFHFRDEHELLLVNNWDLMPHELPQGRWDNVPVDI